MALDATDENVGVLDILINTVQTDLGDLAVKVFPSQTDEGSPGAVDVPGTPPKTATGAQSGDVKVTLASIEGLTDDLMSLIEDGSLKQTPALTNLIKTLIMLKDEALALDDVFEPGNSIDATDLARLESFYHDFGSALVLAREGAAADSDPVVMTQTRGQLRIGATTDDETGDVEDVAMDDSDDAEPVTDDTDTDDGDDDAPVMGDMEATDPPAEVAPEAPSIATVTGDATALLADLAALDILLMLLLETQANADTPQLVDGIDIDPLIERVAELITEIQGLVSDLMSDPDGDPAAATEALAEKRAEIEQLQQTVAALNSDAPVDDTNGPTIATTTADANTLIDELGALDARLMALLETQADADGPQLLDGVSVGPLIERVMALITEIQDYMSDVLTDPDADLEAATTFLAEKSAETTGITEVVDALDSVGSTDADPVESEEGADGGSDPVSDPVTEDGDVADDPVEGGDTDEGVVEGDETDEGGVDEETDSDPVLETGTTTEPEGPTIASVTIEASELLGELGALDTLLMSLLETQTDADGPQLLDGVSVGPLIERVMALITEIQDFMSDVLNDPDADPQAAADFLAEKRAEIAAISGVVDALDVSGGTDAETDETGEVDPLADPEVVDVPEPEPTLADVTAEARELMAGLNNLDDLLMFMLELQADGDSIQFIDAVTLGPYIDKVAAKLTEIGEMVNQLVNSDTPDVQGALDYLAEQRAEIADIQDFADSVVVTLPDDLDVPFTDLDETGPPAPTDAADGPTRTDATTTTQDLLDELSALDAEILGILMEQYDADEPQLVDGVVWAPYMELITKLQGDIPEQVLEFLGGPDPDVQGALDFLAEQGDIVANIRDFIDSLKNGGQTADPDPTNPPALDWDDAAPATRIDLAELSQSLLDNFGALVFDLMVLLETQADADNPQLIDAIDWGGFLDAAKALIAEIKAEFPALLPGDLTSGDYTDADIQAAFTYLEKKKAEFENLRGRVDAFVDMDPLAVDQGRVWGDPHFVGADGGKYDVQGVAGNYYNILSDDGLQVNARFDEFAGPNSGQTVMGAIGITLGTDTVEVSATEGVKINGETVEAGTYLDGKVTVLENGSVEINEQEYSFRIDGP